MKQYDNIRIFRAAACLGVFVTHLAPYLGIEGTAAWLANQGAAGVYLFFMISGFLAGGDRELLSGRKHAALRYYKKRLLRLLPLYYAVVLYNMALHILILRDVPADPDGLGAIINSSRGIIAAYQQEKYAKFGAANYAEASRQAVIDMREDIAQALAGAKA